MAVIAEDGRWHAIDVEEATQVGAARRLAARLSEYAELSETAAGHVSVVVVELATNLVKHAKRGRLLMKMVGRQDGACVDVMSIDHGPGMDLAQCFRDGYSTGGTGGTGLGAVQRMASAFDAYSDAKGSVLFARLGKSDGPSHGSVALALHGELLSGDQWQLIAHDNGWSLAVVDGLGHGPVAHTAAREAIAAFTEHPHDPRRCLEVAHERSRSTRGSACSIIVYDRAQGLLTHAGVGNVSTLVSTRDDSRGVPSQNGTLGVACPRLQTNKIPVEGDALVILHSDGVSARWSLDNYPGLRVRHPQVIAGTLFRDGHRVRDDATLVVVQVKGGE